MLVILFGIWLGFSGVQWYFHNISSKNAFLQFSVGEQESFQRYLSYELTFITAFSKICSSNSKFEKSQIFEQNPVFWLYTRNFAHFTLQEVWTVKFACAIVYSVGHGMTRGIHLYCMFMKRQFCNCLHVIPIKSQNEGKFWEKDKICPKNSKTNEAWQMKTWSLAEPPLCD